MNVSIRDFIKQPKYFTVRIHSIPTYTQHNLYGVLQVSPTDQNTVLTLPIVRVQDERSAVFLDVVRWMMWRKLRINLQQVYIYGLPHAQNICIEKGAVLTPNRQSYLDNPLFFLLSEKIGPRAFLYMAQTALSNNGYLRWCGAIPLNTMESHMGDAQLLQAHRLCSEPTQLWLFGEQQPSGMRPANLHARASLLATGTDSPIIPVSIDYLYKDENEQPIAYVVFSHPLSSTANRVEIEQSVQHGHQLIHQFHMGSDVEGFIPTFKRRVRPRRTSLFARVLGWFAKWKLDPL